MSDKIRLLSDQPDITNHSKVYKKGEILDLGEKRNTNAVNQGKAEWVKSEKVESPKKTSTSVKGKKIETK